MESDPSDDGSFAAAVLDYYRREGRDMAWRRTDDPWSILVSEAMLQQTQVARVEPKYDAWMRRFPDAASLASAGVADVYEAWKGLGYNSRALRLREAAAICVNAHGGQPPDDEAALLELPGVGRYTSRAVLAFAYSRPTVFLETNIRSALIFHFFPGREKVTDRELEARAGVLLAEALKRTDPRSWYYALMDYGAWLKAREPNPSRRSAAYARQSRFEGSRRQARGAVLRAVSSGAADLASIAAEAGMDYGRAREAAEGLARDGFVVITGDAVRFSGG